MNSDDRFTRLDPEDYYHSPEGYLVFTEAYHLKRGYCCQNGCKHCPYGFNKPSHTTRNNNASPQE
ncbi:MAG: hypothetical protein H6585_00915 [Flavobacteriales bacterium]|nr:hypothetical protein [Flavobacteriales bacterium]MCB9446887.1 hypothetical protein [Flavobacteriales bacterium]